MKNIRRIALVLTTIAGLAWANTVSAQVGAGRIATVDLNKVFNDYYKTPVASGKLKETYDGYAKENEDMVADYRKQIEELNKLREEQDKPEYTPEVREQKKKAVQEKLIETQKLQREIDEFGRTHQQSLQQQMARMRQSILKEINDVIAKEAKDAGYTLVLDKSGNTDKGVPTIIFSQESLDITEEIIKVLNKNAPKAEAAKPETPKTEEKKPDKK